MLDLAALPIAFALTLWDALPVYLSIGLAMTVLLRVLLSSTRFEWCWRLRKPAGLEGVVYSILFLPVLAPVIAIASAALVMIHVRWMSPESPAPSSPGAALKARLEEIIVSVALAGILASIIKVFAPDIPAHIAATSGIAALAGFIVGFRSGAIAIPAVALSVHAGGNIAGIICIATSVIRSGIDAKRAFSKKTKL